MKKYTKRNILEQRKTWRQKQSHCRSIAAINPIDRQKLQRREAKGRELADRLRFISRSIDRSLKEKQRKPESLPINRAKLADRSAQLREAARSNADRSWHSSRSIGRQRFLMRISADRSRVSSRSIGQTSWSSTTSFSKRKRFRNSSKIRSNLVLYK